MKQHSKSLFAFLFIFPFLGFSLAQESNKEIPKITAEKMRLLVLPSQVGPVDPASIESEVTSVIVSTATQLGRFEVIDRHMLGTILEEQAIQLTGAINDSMVVTVGNIASAREAMIVNVLNFSQKGVPPKANEYNKGDDDDDDDKGGIFETIFVGVVKGIFSGARPDDPFPNNIETNLSVEIRKVDIETARTLQSIPIEVAHTGGTRGKSRSEAIRKLRDKTYQELKAFYKLTSEVVSVEGGEIYLVLGGNVGVKEGMVFEIITPEKEKTYGERTIKIPGRRVGFIAVKEPGTESNRSEVLRQWRSIKPGYQALEHPNYMWGLQVDLMPNLIPDDYFGFGIQFRGRPIHTLDWGGGMRVVQVKDSFGGNDTGFGLDGFGGVRFLRISRLVLSARLGLGFDVVFRTDDQDHSVNAIFLNAPLGLDAEILIGPKTDLVVSAGYRMGGKTGKWTYSTGGENSESKPAVWLNGAPQIDVSGTFVSVGLKFLIF